MNQIFADTFFWIAGTNPLDQAHERAIDLSRSVRSILTTEEVLTEYLNHFASRGLHLRRRAASRVRQIIRNDAVTVVSQSTASFQAGLELYVSRMDKGYSLTDCISMVTMRREGIVDVLTNDAHFEQEGFRAIFREQQ